jgi:hypothetical protein
VTFTWGYLGSPFPSSADGLFGTAATVASVFAGFIGAAGAIILTIKDTELYKLLVKSGHMGDIISYLAVALFVATGLAALSLAAFFVPTASENHPLRPAYLTVWIFVACLSFCTFYRASRIIFLLLKQSVSSEP